MRILFVHERHGFFGGVEANVFDTARALREKGHETFLLAREGTGRREDEFAHAFAGVLPLWTGDSPDPETLRRHAGETGADVVYAHKVAETHAFGGLGVRKVRAIHDHDVTCPRRHKYFLGSERCCDLPIGWRCYADLAFLEKRDGIRLKSIAAAKREARRQNDFDLVIANSRAMAREVEMNGVSNSRLRVLHPVVPEIDVPLTPLPKAPHVLFVGQLVRGKGVDLLLRAMALSTTPWRLTVVGEGNMRTELEGMAKDLGIEARTEFRGWVPAEATRALYDEARVVAVPSRWPEPFGMVGVEAMRRGRPVVAFAVGGIPDWLQNGVTGLSVPEGDFNALSTAIQTLLTDRRLADDLGRNARQSASEEFGFDRYIGALEAALAGLP